MREDEGGGVGEEEDISSPLSPLYSPSRIKRGSDREDDRGWGRCLEERWRGWDVQIGVQGLGRINEMVRAKFRAGIL